MDKRAKLKKIIAENRFEYLEVDKNKYRVGYCARCGECCKTLNIRVSLNDEVAKWIEMHGIKVIRLNEGSGILSYRSACSALCSTSDYSCGIYDTRPSMCVSYPRSPSSHDSCMYVFIDKMELDWFLRQKRTE